MEFYEKLQKLRKENGMSQEELATRLNVSRQAVSKWENGQGFPETEKLLTISNLYGVSLDYLLKSEGNPAEEPTERGYYASREKVEGYLAMKQRGAFRIAVAVSIIILSVGLASTLQSEIGGMLMLLGVAVGVAILVASIFIPKQYTEIEAQPLVFDGGFIREFKALYLAQRKKLGMAIVFGIMLFFLAVILIIVAENILYITAGKYMFFVFLLVATGVFILILAGSGLSSAKIISENEKYIAEQEEEKSNGWVFGVIMPVAVGIYLLCGFVWNSWATAWPVFPVAAMLGVAVLNFTGRKSSL